MSHIVSIRTRITSFPSIAAACRRLELSEPIEGVAQLFEGEVQGVVVQLLGWRYPIVIDLPTGIVKYDHYEGRWGNPVHLDRLLQAYAVERTLAEARKKGLAVHEEALRDGSIRLQIVESN